jgi:hypothetical protein
MRLPRACARSVGTPSLLTYEVEMLSSRGLTALVDSSSDARI